MPKGNDPNPLRRTLTDYFGALDGQRIPGGCEVCDAYQTVTPIVAGAWSINVFHDDGCPVLARHQAATQ